MTGKTHFTYGVGLGVITAVATANSLNTPDWMGALEVVSCAVGSLAPDIDNKSSTISKVIPLIPTIINKMFGHRGFIHSPLCIGIIFLITFILLQYNKDLEYYPILLAFTIGYISHLLLDMMTKGGIQMLYPFSRKKWRVTNLKSGGYIEIIAMIFLGIIMLVSLTYILYPQLWKFIGIDIT